MKNRIVIWGKNEQDERVLIALELKPEANKVNLYSFPESVASDDFTKKMMDEWRTGVDFEMPEGSSKSERDLAVTESLLPDNLKVERGDIINRAQSEWHFVVLSHKMSQQYQSELQELREKVAAMSSYDKKAWDTVKGFWDKVSEQVKERNLFREHSDSLRDGINEVFEQLKTLRTQADASFKEGSVKVLAELNASMDAIDAKIQSGNGRFAAIFDELKGLQSKYRQTRLTREDGDQIWNRLDSAFKAAKEKRFGPAANEGSVADRHDSRLRGLLEAIQKMQSSVDRDAEELKFQEKRISMSEGQMEAQIRTAKIRMVKERLVSKQEKLDEMLKTKAEVEAQAAQTKERDAKRSEKDAEREKLATAQEIAKARIDSQARAAAAAPVAVAAPVVAIASAAVAEKSTIDQAAETTVNILADVSEKGSEIFGALGSVFGDVFEQLGDTVKAVAEVVGDKIEEAMQDAKTTVAEVVEEKTAEEEKKADA
jgi:hypothetical protein